MQSSILEGNKFFTSYFEINFQLKANELKDNL
jgi:hypothetical protein